MQDPERGQRQVRVDFSREPDHMRFTISDMGAGFDWERYQNAEPASLMSSHGRGILIARKLSFDGLYYQGCGNIVEARVNSQR